MATDDGLAAEDPRVDGDPGQQGVLFHAGRHIPIVVPPHEAPPVGGDIESRTVA
jgi:hypothetical protein